MSNSPPQGFAMHLDDCVSFSDHWRTHYLFTVSDHNNQQIRARNG